MIFDDVRYMFGIRFLCSCVTQFTDVFRSVSINSKEILVLDFLKLHSRQIRGTRLPLQFLSQPQSRSLLSAYNSLLIKIILSPIHSYSDLQYEPHVMQPVLQKTRKTPYNSKKSNIRSQNSTELGLSLNKNCIYKIQKFQIGSYQKGTSGSTYSVFVV